MAGYSHFVRPVLFAGYCLSVMLAACSNSAEVVIEEPQSEVIHSFEAGVGKGSAASRLQGLVVLPVVLDISPEDPEHCMDVCQPLRDRAEIALGASKYLASPLAYDVICLDLACRRFMENPYSDETLSGWAAAIANWANENPGARQLPQDLHNIARQIQTTFGADGLVVIHGNLRYVQNADMWHWLATLTASMYYNLLRGNTAQLHADIFAADSGRRLWSAKSTITNIGQVPSGPVAEADQRYGLAVFGELEPAAATVPVAPPES